MSTFPSASNNTVKRQLRIGSNYRITKVHGATPLELLRQQLRIVVQFPDGHLPHDVLAVQAVVLSGSHTGETFYVQARLLHQPANGGVCRCGGYRWPHRRGSKRCVANEAAPFCGLCGLPCDIARSGLFKTGDPISSCCHSPDLYQDCELTRPYSRDQ